MASPDLPGWYPLGGSGRRSSLGHDAPHPLRRDKSQPSQTDRRLIHALGDFSPAAAHARRSSERRGGFLMHHSLRQARPWQKPLKYHTWSRPTAHWGGKSMLTVRITCFPTAYIDVNFAPHPHWR